MTSRGRRTYMEQYSPKLSSPDDYQTKIPDLPDSNTIDNDNYH